MKSLTLIIKNVTKKYKNTKAVNDISLQLPKGEMLFFLGRNVAGKTTTFRMILGLTKIIESAIRGQSIVIDYGYKIV